MLTTLQLPSETPGQPSRASFTPPSPNSNSQPQPRDSPPSPQPFPRCATPHSVPCSLSQTFVSFLSLSLLDHSWRISSASLIKSGTRGPLRWLSARGADREAQSFDWPTTAQQSCSQSPSPAADAIVPMNTDAPSQDPHRSAHDAFAQTDSQAPDASTQLSWSILPRRSIRLDIDDSYAGPLSRAAPVNAGRWGALPPLISSRFAGPPGLPPPPALEVQHDCRVPFDFVPPAAKAKPQRTSQADDTSTAPAGISNVILLSSAREQPVSTVHAGTLPAPLPSGHQQRYASTAHAGRQAPIRNADRTGHEPFPKPAVLVHPMSPRLVGPVPLDDSRNDLMHCQCRLSVLHWNPGPARKNDTQIIPAACGRFHEVILQEAGGHVPHI